MQLLRSSPALTQYNSNTRYNTQHYWDNCTQQWLKDDSAQRLYHKYSERIHLSRRTLRVPRAVTVCVATQHMSSHFRLRPGYEYHPNRAIFNTIFVTPL